MLPHPRPSSSISSVQMKVLFILGIGHWRRSGDEDESAVGGVDGGG